MFYVALKNNWNLFFNGKLGLRKQTLWGNWRIGDSRQIVKHINAVTVKTYKYVESNVEPVSFCYQFDLHSPYLV